MAVQVTFFVAIVVVLISLNAKKSMADVQGYPKFSYSSNDTGPAKWGSLKPEYMMCSTGKSQSPIDIVIDNVVLNKKLKPLKREYHPVNATLVNNGYNIEMQFGNAGVMTLDGRNYTFVQMHWHAPAEHRINGVVYDTELHLVHKAADGNLSVVAIIYKIGGTADPLLTKVQSKFAELAKKNYENHEEARISVRTFEAWMLTRNTRKYYRYVGSLTTPPCSENVIFNIFVKVKSISKEQVNALKAPLLSTCKSNNRPVQPINGRRVELFNEFY